MKHLSREDIWSMGANELRHLCELHASTIQQQAYNIKEKQKIIDKLIADHADEKERLECGIQNLLKLGIRQAD